MSVGFKASPICIFSFNRPDYLRETLLSIGQSMKASGMVGPVILFQDGSFSPHTNVRKSEPELIRLCKEYFQELMPHGVIFESAMNLGIASNIYRAEKWAFEEIGYDVAMFFEDDMVIAPRYFEALAQLNLLAEKDPRIGMFAAYGSDGRMTPQHQHQKRASVSGMHHNWAFALRRTAWDARELHTRAYMDIIEENDYRLRSSYRIASWYTQMGWPPLATNQDIAKNVCLNHVGMIRISTSVILAKYIGRLGEHYTNEEYERLGFGEVALYSDHFPEQDIELDPLTSADVERLWSSQRETLLGTRVATTQLLLSPEFATSMQIIAAVAGGNDISSRSGSYLDFASGIYGDLWCGPRFSMTIKDSVDISRLQIVGRLASHLPQHAVIEFTLNGKKVATVENSRSAFVTTFEISPNLRALKKILTSNCSVVSDPFSAGAGADRRSLAFHITSITLYTAKSEIILRGPDLLAEVGYVEKK